MSSDWSVSREPIPYASLADPQTFNLYAYVRNSPAAKEDSDGHRTPGSLGETGFIYIPSGSVSGELDRLQTTLASASFLPGSWGRAAAVLNAGISFFRGKKGEAAANLATVVPLGKLSKAERLAANVEKGVAGEVKAAEALETEGRTILGSQVSVRTENGLRRVDYVTENAGSLTNVEVKTGGATRNAAQMAKDDLIENQGGTFVGKNAPDKLRGKTVKVPTEVKKIE